ncbi:MAG: hypothetical protein ACREQ8_09460 [Woeseiaceae bacterium]
MKTPFRAALAASMILTGSAVLSTAALADDPKNEEKTVTSTIEVNQLQRDLELRALQDAAAMAADAMTAATNLNLDIRSAASMSVLLVSEL